MAAQVLAASACILSLADVIAIGQAFPAMICCWSVLIVRPRSVPMEIRVTGEKEPIYDFNLEELGRYNEQPVLPFNAYGTLAWARAEFDNNRCDPKSAALLLMGVLPVCVASQGV
jgi:hypothetical protein